MDIIQPSCSHMLIECGLGWCAVCPPSSGSWSLNGWLCPVQELYQDFQRTTEQLVKDKLQEQRVRNPLVNCRLLF